MTTTTTIDPGRRLVASLLILDAALVVAYLVEEASGQPIDRLGQLLDVGDETSVSTWYSVVKLFAVAALALTFAWSHLRVDAAQRDRRDWLLVALGLGILLISIDEITQIHEWIGVRSDALLEDGDRASSPLPETGLWTILIGIPAVIMFAAMLYLLRPRLNAQPGAYRLVAGGMAVLLIGATGFESLSNVFDDPDSAGFHITSAFEEGFEMLGATAMAAGFLRLMRPTVTLDLATA